MKPHFQDQNLTLYRGDWMAVLKSLPEESVQCCVTSPPYWGLRSYLAKDDPEKVHELGSEKTPEEYVAKMVAGFREVRRVLRKDATLWMNLGDSYAAGANNTGSHKDGSKQTTSAGTQFNYVQKPTPGYKPKDLCGIPWMVAFALRADGWYLRSDIIWHKPNPMPESVGDRPTKAHEYLFLLSKSERYFYDAEAIREPAKESTLRQVMDGYNGEASKDFAGQGVQDASATKRRVIDGLRKRVDKQRGHSKSHNGFNEKWDHMTVAEQMACGSNKRSVWTVPTFCYPESHFATFPPDLIRPCILAGTRLGDTVLDPFGGSGTTAKVAIEHGRKAVIIELNEDYLPLITNRTNVTPGLNL